MMNPGPIPSDMNSSRNNLTPTIARLGNGDVPVAPGTGIIGTNIRNINNNNNNIDANFDPWVAAPLDGGGLGSIDAQALWRERERRQRSIRVLMMFLLMLLLMEDPEQSQRRRNGDSGGLRKGKKRNKNATEDLLLNQQLYQARKIQDEMIQERLWQHPRYLHLLARNVGKNVDFEVRQWAEQQLELQTDEFAPLDGDPNASVDISKIKSSIQSDSPDSESDLSAWHYPWNATGFYRGDWSKQEPGRDAEEGTGDTQLRKTADGNRLVSTGVPVSYKKIHPVDAEIPLLDFLKQKKDSTVGVHLLPLGMELELPNITSNRIADTDSSEPTPTVRKTRTVPYQSPFLRGTTPASSFHTIEDRNHDEAQLTLTKSSGRAAFQLFSRTIPAMKELSIVDGFLKLYDSNTVGYSTRHDLLLRVHGVLIHSLGKMSLVANTQTPGRAALLISKGSERVFETRETLEDRRRLQEALKNVSIGLETDIQEIRERALELFHTSKDKVAKDSTLLERFPVLDFIDGASEAEDLHSQRRQLAHGDRDKKLSSIIHANVSDEMSLNMPDNGTLAYEFSKHVIPFPFVWDDDEQSLQKHRLPSSARTMPPREQLLEANAGNCEFEIMMNVQEEKWTVGPWRKLMHKQLQEAILLDPSLVDPNGNIHKEEREPKKSDARIQKKKHNSKSQGFTRSDLQQALVMTLNGTIISPSCNFVASINATAIRTDWEHTTGKAINYSFYMMLTCLTQIVLLLRQLLHTQAQSAATRVSLMCIGWQTVLDALLCLVHIYLSLAMQPLFTAFASVAFFKLLIFCVIEMKYMAIIIQARNASNGGNTIELLRRQIAMLHLRFYVALLASCLGFFYSGETYRTAYMLFLYSFWVPQIVQNVMTEAKRPLHPYYVYGMSLSRLVAPIYIFAVQNNFLKEVYPESPTNAFMCQLLVLWVGIQAAILEAQGRYGPRFMIPARFLPPKFDYNRPIPPSLLPKVLETTNPTEELRNERSLATTEVRSLVVPKRDTSPFGSGARNRMKGSRLNRAETGMTAETVTSCPKNPSMAKFECVICYNEIDINNRTGYMLAPCDHLFHKDCLVQWMEVKMDCPICRASLPPI